MEKALITGITGQDGSYLAELLLQKGYEVHGILRRTSAFSRGRIDHLRHISKTRQGRFFLHYGDLADSMSLFKLVEKIAPSEIYNLAAQSHVKVSFENPEYTSDIVATGTLRLLEANLQTGVMARFYQASSSEMFGKVRKTPQTELTPFHPRSPYGAAKVFAHHLTVNYRESYDMHASCGILYNHESPRRGENFVTKKISQSVAKIQKGLLDKLVLGNIDTQRDWGFAGDYVKAMWAMLQKDTPDDYIIATGKIHSVREFLKVAFNRIGKNYEEYLEISSDYFRPSETGILQGDYSKAEKQLGWRPTIQFKELVHLMVDADISILSSQNI
jgi:GDPmannose 4,6-dehydratase